MHERLQDRAVGENRQKLMTAYAEYRLAKATIERNRDLYDQKLITPKQFERVNASYEVVQATLPEPDGRIGLRGEAGEQPRPPGAADRRRHR